MIDRGHLLTEQRNPRSRRIDALDTLAAVELMNSEHASIAKALHAAKREIAAAVERAVYSLRQGGRLIYVGAGTSGRLGVLDAAECPPTFLTDPRMVQGVIAGGDAALRRSIEHAEDDQAAGAAAMAALKIGKADAVMGIAAGGTTPYVHGALKEAKRRGARTIFLACVPKDQAPDSANVSIRVLTGPEVITGSTRLKAGIATKMVLNTISTLAMVKLGKVYENLMVDVDAGRCEKLTDRAIRIVAELCGLRRNAATRLLTQAAWQVKIAVVMHHRGVGRDEAARLLSANGGMIRPVIDRRIESKSKRGAAAAAGRNGKLQGIPASAGHVRSHSVRSAARIRKNGPAE